jgi:hypothetical protein
VVNFVAPKINTFTDMKTSPPFPASVAALLDLEGLSLSGKKDRGDVAGLKAKLASITIGTGLEVRV